MISKKTLYLLRHAKAEGAQPHQEDHLRKLAARGLSDAALIGAFLVGQGVQLDRILCSTAVRTAETLVKLEEAYRHTLPVKYSDKLYHASANEILAQVALVDEQVARLMVIGHNPGLHQLAVTLAKSGEEPLLEALMMKLPTGTFIELEFTGCSWNGLKHAGGRLVQFVPPSRIGGGEK